MTVAKNQTIAQMAQRIVPHEESATVLDSLGTAWRRAAKGSDKSPPVPLGAFGKDRNDLTDIELRFVTTWLEKRANVEPTAAQPTPSVVPSDKADFQNQMQKAIEREKAKWQRESEADKQAAIVEALSAEREKHQATIAANREQYKLIHDAALQKALADERKVIEAEKQRLQSANEAKLERERQQLQQSGKQNSELTAKAAIAEEKAKITAEFEQKVETKAQQAIAKRDAEFAKERAQWAVKIKADTEGWTTEKEFLLNDKKEAIETLMQEHEANIETLKQERDLAQSEADRLAWKKKLPTNYDVVNITSNLIAAYGLYNMLGINGVILALMLISFFLGIVKDLKKVERKNAAWFGIIAAVIIEVVYGYIHNTLFQDLLKNKEHLGFDYHFVGTAFAVIISGASIYAALMTRLRTQDDAEAKRVNDIENSFNNN